MKHTIYRILLCSALMGGALSVTAQDLKKTPTPERYYYEGSTLFRQGAYAAAQPPLQIYLEQLMPDPTTATKRQETTYMLACIAYELDEPNCIDQLQAVLDEFPDTPHANRIYALIAAAHHKNKEYEEALAVFSKTRLDLLGNRERDDMTFRLAQCYLETGNVQDAAIWFETLRNTTSRYEEECTYYLSYIRYTHQRYDEALRGFLSLQGSKKYEEIVPYYIAECYLQKKHYDKAEIVAQNYLSAHPHQQYAAEMHRIEGSAHYHYGKYHEAVKDFEAYLNDKNVEPRRDAFYMLGLSYYRTGIYTQVPATLSEVTRENDALAQNAYLHMGLAYLQLADKNKARMAFEQAAASDADRKVKEQAAYNYALCIHETAYSAFGESVNVFEKFLNDFPQSVYADRVSDYLVDVYMETRSYDAALQSIERIKQPGARILTAKQRILFQLGAQAFANADFNQALERFRESSRLNYDRRLTADAHYWTGECLYRLGQMREAESAFNRYLGLAQTSQRNTQTFALAYYNLGYIAFHQKGYTTAEERFLNFLRLEKNKDASLLADAYNRVGDCLMQARRFDEAKQYYTRAESMGTAQSDYSYYQLALVAGLQKDYTGKVALLDQLAAKYPQSPYTVNALYEKGRSYVQAGNNAQAIATFNELVEKYPESPVSRKAATEIGLLYYQANDYDRAIRAYTEVVTRYPGSEEARLAMQDLKSIYVDANRVDEYAALAARMPNTIRFEASEQDSLTYRAAERQRLLGNVQAARTALERYLQSFPNGAFRLNAHYNLMDIAHGQHNEEALLQHADELLKFPDSPYTEEALLLRGEVLFNRKQYADALKDYKQLQARAATAERRRLGATGVMRCAYLTGDDIETIHAATDLLAEAKLDPQLQNEALYRRAKAYLHQKANKKALDDLRQLASDTRTAYGAEAKYLVARQLYEAADYAGAEKEILQFIDQSTPHAYWLARSFVLLADVYMATGKELDARQYLLSLQQNYHADDDIDNMINERLEKLNQQPTAPENE